MASNSKLVQTKNTEGFWIKINTETGEVVGKKHEPYVGVKKVTLEEATAYISKIPKDDGEKQPVEKTIAAENVVEFFTAKASTSDKELVDLDGKGVEIRFDFEDFRELDGDTLEKLSRSNVLRYFAEQALYRKRLRLEEQEGKYGRRSGRIEVMGPNAKRRLQVHNAPEGIHPYWALPEETYDRKRAGYTMLDKERFPEIRAGDSVQGTQRQIKRADGSGPELILMGCPEAVYQDHIEGEAKASRDRAAAELAKFEDKVGQLGKGAAATIEKTSEKIRVKG